MKLNMGDSRWNAEVTDRAFNVRASYKEFKEIKETLAIFQNCIITKRGSSQCTWVSLHYEIDQI